MSENQGQEGDAASHEMTSHRIGDFELKLERPESVFKPNITTHKIATELSGLPAIDCLDLGCGVGPLAIYCALKGARRVDAVDVCAVSCEIAKRNVMHHRVEDKVNVLCGDLYSPVHGNEYDLIIDDVSGVASDVAKMSPWYPPAIQSGGRDGTELVIQVLENAPLYLRTGGTIVFPVLSLSASDRIFDCAHDVFRNGFSILSTFQVPFPQSFLRNMDALESLRDQGCISFEKRGTRYVWTLNICKAVNKGI